MYVKLQAWLAAKQSERQESGSQRSNKKRYVYPSKKNEEEKILAKWIKNQRSDFRKGTLASAGGLDSNREQMLYKLRDLFIPSGSNYVLSVN